MTEHGRRQRLQDRRSRCGNRITGIVSSNDDMAISSFQALRETDSAGKMPITAIESGLLEPGLRLQVVVNAIQGRDVPEIAVAVMAEIARPDVNHDVPPCGSPFRVLAELPAPITPNPALGNGTAR